MTARPRPMAPRAVGVDLSLASTGLADSHGRTKRVRTKPGGKGQRPVAEVLERLRTITGAVDEFVNRRVEDSITGHGHVAFDLPSLVVVEGPSHNSPGQQHKLGGLWWMAVEAINGGPIINDPPVPVLVVTPAQRMKYATGKGRAEKDEVLAAAVKRYPAWDITGNDIADAVILAAIGSRLLGHPLEDTLPKANLDALAKLAVTP